VSKFRAAGWGDSPRTRASRTGTPLRNRYFTTITGSSSSVRMVADRHRLAAYHNKHCWWAFQWYQHRWPWTTLNPQKFFSNFFLRFQAVTTFPQRAAPKPLEIYQDNIRTKSPAFNTDFNSARFDPLCLRSPPYECIKFGYPIQNARFLLLSTNLAREWLQIDTDLSRIITSTADNISWGTNIDDLERPTYRWSYGDRQQLSVNNATEWSWHYLLLPERRT